MMSWVVVAKALEVNPRSVTMNICKGSGKMPKTASQITDIIKSYLEVLKRKGIPIQKVFRWN